MLDVVNYEVHVCIFVQRGEPLFGVRQNWCFIRPADLLSQAIRPGRGCQGRPDCRAARSRSAQGCPDLACLSRLPAFCPCLPRPSAAGQRNHQPLVRVV